VFFITAALFAYSFLISLKAYKEKRKKTAIYLLVLFLGCALISICSGLDALLYDKNGFYNLRYGYAISLIFTGVSIIGLMYFAIEIFSSEAIKKPMQAIKLIFSIVVLVISVWGTITLMPGQTFTTTIPLILISIITDTLYIVLALRAYGLAKRVEDVYYKKAIKSIGHFALLNLALYLSFILDGVLAAITSDPELQGTSVFSLIGACIFAFTAYLAYKGFVKPMTTRA
jgi:hypothetical protein